MAALPDDRALGMKIARGMTDNGAAYRSRRFARRLRRLKIWHLCTQP
jgi:integrase, catalytic region